MKAEVTIENLYWNTGLADFFFREQSYEQFETIVREAQNNNCEQELYDILEDMFTDLDNLEEYFYSTDIEEIKDELGRQLFE